MKVTAAALAVCTSFLALSIVLAQSQNSDKSPTGAVPKYDPAIYAELQKAPEKARNRTNPLQNDPDAVAAGAVLFEQRCAECHGDAARGGKKGPNPSAGSSCGTSNHWAGLLRRPSLPLRNLDGRILIRSLGCLVQNHRQTHASFRQACFHGLGGVGLISLADGKTLLEHSPSHVIVFGAALQFHVRFDADFFREAIVDGGFRSLVALPGPVVHMDAGSFPGGALRAKLFVQFVGVSKRVGDFHVAFHNLRVPDLMKVGRIILTFRMERIEKRFMVKIFHRHTVCAVVGIGDGMQWLMQIAYKMDEIAYCFGAFQGIGGLIFQDGALLFDGARHASFRTAVPVKLSLVLS